MRLFRGLKSAGRNGRSTARISTRHLCLPSIPSMGPVGILAAITETRIIGVSQLRISNPQSRRYRNSKRFIMRRRLVAMLPDLGWQADMPDNPAPNGAMSSPKKIPKPVLFGGIAVLGIGGFIWYRRQAASAGPVIDTTGSIPDTSGLDTSSAGGAGDGGANVGIFQQPSPGTNESWDQEAVSALQLSGFSAHVAGLAISRVLGGQTVTPEQEQIFLQAVGLLGPPPAGYPAPIKVQGGTAPPTGVNKAIRHIDSLQENLLL